MKADFTMFFLIIFAIAAFAGWDWPNIAKIMPVYIAAPSRARARATLPRNKWLGEAPRRRLWRHGSI
jgi:hypothetical protein